MGRLFFCGCCWTENATFIATSSGQLFVVVLVVGAGGFIYLFIFWWVLLIKNATFIATSSGQLFVVVVVLVVILG